MIKFLIDRPVSVIMAFLACCILGMVTLFNIPVTLLPDIPIPEITVQITGNNTSARQLENTVVKPVRQQLTQLVGLRDIKTETRDGGALVRLSFDYGIDTDLAFVEVNEKIDAAMNFLPKDIDRPRVIKASATDIPVEYLNLTLRSDRDFENTNESKFLGLCEYSETVIKRRIEQLPEVSMVAVTGLMKKQVVIHLDNNKLEIAGILLSDIESALNINNVEPGSMVVHDGHYEYNIRFSSVLRTLEDVQGIFIRKEGRIYRMSDLARVEFAPQKETGMSLYNGKRCIKMAIIKQADENMDDMQAALDKVITDLEMTYPDIEFHVTENQTELLDYTISNLEQNLILAFLFVWLISVFFMKDMSSPIIIGISMIVSVIISLLFFYLCGLSINIISLTGLILASGNMIDNSLVVTDNISQYQERGMSPEDACIKGTNEVIAPMLSSMFTSISVFAPLVFLSGIAGALFYDQALSVTLGLLVSYLTGIMLLPVLFKLFCTIRFNRFSRFIKRLYNTDKISDPNKVSIAEQLYYNGIKWIFAHQKLTAISMLAILPFCAFLFWFIPKEKMPDLNQKEMVTSIEWNENIHVNDNLECTRELLHFMEPKVVEQTGLVGQQQFLLNRGRQRTSSETELYLKAADSKEIYVLQESIRSYLKAHYPKALVTFAPTGTIFEKIFSTGEADMVVECYTTNRTLAPTSADIGQIVHELRVQTKDIPEGVSFQKQLNLHIDREKLLYHNIPYDVVYQSLKTAFQGNEFATLRSYQQYLPVVLGSEEKTVKEILENTLIPTSQNEFGAMTKLSLNRFVTVSTSEELKTLISGKAGEYIPLMYYNSKNPEKIIQAVQKIGSNNETWDFDLSGGFFSNKKMIGELMVILLISILLMYFILVSQFESFVQPFIILLEIPIDLAAALVLLMSLGYTLNLMSAIGMVVTCGIVINDSILKVDMINQLRKGGMKIMDAIHEAGHRRLKSILMTSFTSIICMVPLLFTHDLGSELEKPLALATIGGMLIGTPVSLFVVPLVYWWIYSKEEKKNLREKLKKVSEKKSNL